VRITAPAKETIDIFMRTRIGHKVLFGTGIGMIMVLMLIMMVHIQGVKAYNQAQEAVRKKDPVQAAAHYENTIRWYLPFAKRIESAVHNLWDIGQHAEKQGDNELAREVYLRLRSSLCAIQSFYAPYQDWIVRCDQKIMVAAKGPDMAMDPIGQHNNVDRSKDGILPRAPWSLVMVIGFWGWILGTVGYIQYGFEPNHTGAKLYLLRWTGANIGFYCIWLISLAKA
jgi:hypothetical protein